jgi:hypothetical protein
VPPPSADGAPPQTDTPPPATDPSAPPAAAQPPAPASDQPPPNWDDLRAAADEPRPRQSTGGFQSRNARVGNREVIVVEGKVGEQIPQSDTLADYTPTRPGEHATHAVGMQLGENLPEGITSGPGADLNLSALKTVENATRDVMERAVEVGASVETKTTIQVEHQVINGEDVPVLTGVTREASVRLPGSDTSYPFVDFEAQVDPVTRQVTIVRNNITRPPSR